MRTAQKASLMLILSLFLFFPRPASALNPVDLLHAGAAFLTHLGIHEAGHYVVGYMGGAQDVSLEFLSQRDGSFFLGRSTAKGIDREASLSYKLGGEAASSYLFEVALMQYRIQPTVYNRSLVFFSGTDFLWYSIWAFYISGKEDPAFDPVGISQETGLSAETVFGIALLQTALNSYRVYSGSDVLIPYIGLDARSAEFGIRVMF